MSYSDSPSTSLILTSTSSDETVAKATVDLAESAMSHSAKTKSRYSNRDSLRATLEATATAGKASTEPYYSFSGSSVLGMYFHNLL